MRSWARPVPIRGPGQFIPEAAGEQVPPAMSPVSALDPAGPGNQATGRQCQGQGGLEV